MTTYNTGNPIGSKDPRDLYDNAENLDTAVNDTSRDTWSDRLGRSRKTMSGMEREFNADQASRDNRFNTFIASSGYQFLGDYAAGIEITEYNQIVRDADGEFWRLSGQVELPYTTTGAGLPEDDSLTPLGDAVLRQELANPDMGAAMIGFTQEGIGAVAQTLENKVRSVEFSFDDFKGVVGDGVHDDTEGMQKAIDAAPEGSIIKANPTKTYKFRRIQTNKSLTLDFCGAHLIVDPSEGNTVGDGKGGAIQFSGTGGDYYSFNDLPMCSDVVVCSNPSDAANFAPDDYVLVLDSERTPAWDDPNGTGESLSGVGSRALVDKMELNIVKSVNVATGEIWLKRNTEFAYTTTAQIRKLNLLHAPKVMNIGSIVEIDPGSAHTGPVERGPNLITFNRCKHPTVNNVNISGFNMRAIQFSYCWMPIADSVQAKTAFRPNVGGHGYLLQFARSVLGIASRCCGQGLRHVIDFTQSFDCVSQNNLSVDPRSVSYYCHGHMSKRCKSIDDVVYNNRTGSTGWAAGNPAFTKDYDFHIIRPVFYGVKSVAVRSRCLSEGTTVIDPFFVYTKDSAVTGNVIVIDVTTGAKNTSIRGGIIDLSECIGAFSKDVISANDVIVGRESYEIKPSNLEVTGTKILLSVGVSKAGVLRGMSGNVVWSPSVFGGGSDCTNLHVYSSSSLENLLAEGGSYYGEFERGFYMQSAPSNVYRIRNNNNFATYSISYLSTPAVTPLIDIDPAQGVLLVDDESIELRYGVTPDAIVYNSPITANRTVTLDSYRAPTGFRARIVRSAGATGAFKVNVGTGTAVKQLDPGEWCDVIYTGTTLELVAYGVL